MRSIIMYAQEKFVFALLCNDEFLYNEKEAHLSIFVVLQLQLQKQMLELLQKLFIITKIVYCHVII